MKKMINRKIASARNILIMTLAFLPAVTAFAQQQGRGQDARMEAIESRRIAFLTEKMMLTPDEARVFWPLYNEYNKKRDDLTNDHRNRWPNPEVTSMGNEEAGRYAEELITHMERSAAIKREYHEKLKRILPVKKVALLYEAERDFNRLLFQEARRRAREDAGSGR